MVLYEDNMKVADPNEALVENRSVTRIIDDLFTELDRFERMLGKHGETISPILRSPVPSPVSSEKMGEVPSNDSDIFMRLNNLGRLFSMQVNNLCELTDRVQL